MLVLSAHGRCDHSMMIVQNILDLVDDTVVVSACDGMLSDGALVVGVILVAVVSCVLVMSGCVVVAWVDGVVWSLTGFVLVYDVIHVDAVSCVVGSLSGVVDTVMISAAVVMAGVCEIVSVVVMAVLVIVPPALLDLMVHELLGSVLLDLVMVVVSVVLVD